MKQRVFFFSGMGADDRAFKYLELTDVDPVYINWIKPQKNEQLHAYAMRLIQGWELTKDDILIGLSMGGLIIQEIASVIPVKKIILISSLRSGEQLRPLFTAAQKLQLLNLVQEDLLKSAILSGAKFILPSKKERYKLMVDMLDQYDGAYYKWAMNQVLHWKGVKVACPIDHVHGDKDEVFPVSLVKDAVIVKGGTHLMVAVKAKEVSEVLQKFISAPA